MRKNRERYPLGLNGRMVWGAVCQCCKAPYKLSELQVDHIEPAGSMNGPGGYGGFLDRLLCDESNMQFVCFPCHKILTLAQRKGITFEEAEVEKDALKFMKLPIRTQKQLLKAEGLSDKDISNAKQRRAAFIKSNHP